MELRHLRYFIAVAEELHFTRAAARLHVAQPALSHQIRELEEEIGVTMFTRGTRRVALTEAGRAFLERARVVLDEVATAQRMAQQAAGGERTQIRIGFAAQVGSILLSKPIREHQRRFPGVEFTLHSMGTATQVSGLTGGELDIGLLDRVVAHDKLHFDLVSREPLVVILPPDHRLAARKTIALRDLASEPFIVPPDDRMPPYATALLTACSETGFTPRIAQRAPMVAAFVLVAAGVGIYVSSGLRWIHHADDVVVRPLRSPSLFVELFAARRSDDDSAQLLAFIESLRRSGGALKAERRNAGVR